MRANPPEHRHPRRLDRSRDVDWIEDFLRRGAVTVLAAVADSKPLCLPRLFAYDAERYALYLHGARGGELLEALEEHREQGDGRAPVAATVFQMGRLLPAPEAAEFSVEFGSVVVAGRGVVVEDPDEAMHGLRLLMEKYAPHLEPGKEYRDMAPEEVARTSVIRVDIQAWSGKEKTEAGEFPGAYWYRDVAGRKKDFS
jgi:nitroimidazol reductase NimA-like FMN-containing flavoprotein (pyridoxamine 5'-phosphate oxidase superfamily)